MARDITRPSQPKEDTGSRAGTSNRRGKWTLATLVAVVVLLVATTATGAATRVYSIVAGDTLSNIAANNGTDVETLVTLNGIADPDLIVIGNEISIPDGELTSYTVREGDTLADIAAVYGVSVQELVAVNKISDADLIHVGSVLLLYVPTDGSAAVADDSATEEADVAVPAEVEEADEAEATEEVADSVDAESTDNEASAATDDVENPSAESISGRLHLVEAGETLDDIATEYDVTVEQLVAANALSSQEVTAGMILKIPLASSTAVELIGMPSGMEPWPLMSELAAASIATAYWGAPVTAAELLDSLDRSENPHLGFRGDPQGMFGTTDDYGVYNGPLATALQGFGFTTDAFYADGDQAALTARIDAGSPVVVWITHNLQQQERIVMETESGRYSLIPEKHAALVYGYDESGVRVMDVGTGASANWDWDSFMASWALFDGMGLAIDLE